MGAIKAHFKDKDTKALAGSHVVSRQGVDSNPVGRTPNCEVAIIIHIISNLYPALAQRKLALQYS